MIIRHKVHSLCAQRTLPSVSFSVFSLRAQTVTSEFVLQGGALRGAL